MPRNTLLSVGLAALFALPAAHADMLGVYASASYWQYDGKADVAQTGKTKSAFEFEQQEQPSIELSFEHPVPVVPNVRVRYTALKGNDTAKVSAFEFGGVSFLPSNVNLDVDMTSTDLILYYEILDNIVSADIGIAAKQLDGDIVAKNLLQTKTVSIKEAIPMGYLSAQVKLPLTGLSVKADVAGVAYNGSSLTDAQAELQYAIIDNPVIDINLRAGYRQFTATLEDVEETDADIDFKGPYLGVEFHF